jgi:hypothetical protein
LAQKEGWWQAAQEGLSTLPAASMWTDRQLPLWLRGAVRA